MKKLLLASAVIFGLDMQFAQSAAAEDASKDQQALQFAISIAAVAGATLCDFEMPKAVDGRLNEAGEIMAQKYTAEAVTALMTQTTLLVYDGEKKMGHKAYCIQLQEVIDKNGWFRLVP